MTRNGNKPTVDDDDDDEWDYDVDEVGSNSDSKKPSSGISLPSVSVSPFVAVLLGLVLVSVGLGVYTSPVIGAVFGVTAGVVSFLANKAITKARNRHSTASPEDEILSDDETRTDGGSGTNDQSGYEDAHSAPTSIDTDADDEFPPELETVEEVTSADGNREQLLAQDKEGEMYAGAWPQRMFENAGENPEQPIFIGTKRNRAGLHQEIGIERNTFDTHAAIFGKTGSGKSTLAKNILVQIAKAGEGFCYIDPKGDDVGDLIQMLPEERLEDVVYVDPVALGHDNVVGLNFLEVPLDEDEDGFNEAVSILTENLQEILAEDGYWGPKMKGIAENLIRAMAMSDTNYTLIDMYYVMSDAERRENFAEAIANEGMDFIYEYTKQIAEMENDDMDALICRLKSWTEDPIKRRIIAQEESTVNFYDIIRGNKIVLVKNDSSDDIQKSIGAAFIQAFWTAAVRRAGDIPEDERDRYYLFIDEADAVLNDAMPIEDIFSKARSYKLSLTLMNQYPSQIPDDYLQALFGNADITLSMQIGTYDDARVVAKDFPGVKPEQIKNIDKYRVWVKQLTKASSTEPFVTDTFADYPPQRSPATVRSVIDRSLDKYGVPKQSDEDIKDSLHIPGETTADHESNEKQKQVIARATAIAASAEERNDGYAPISLVKEVNSHLHDFGEYEFSQILEENPDVFETKREGEMLVTLTDHGRNLAKTQDSGSSGSSGKEDHRYLLRRTREEFAKLGIAVGVPEQGGDGAEVDGVGHIFNDTHSILTHNHNSTDPLYIEAESTTTSSPFQTLRNLRKALLDDVKCIFVVKEPADKPLGHYGRKIENIISKRRGYRQHKENGRKRLLYTTNTYLKASKGGSAYPVRPRQNDKQGDLETRWWIEDGELVLRDINGIEYARFDSVDDYPSHSIHDFPAYVKPDDGVFRVYQDGEQVASYQREADLKEEWVYVKEPFIPELEFPRTPDRDDYEIVIIPDNEDDALRYKNGETVPLIDADPEAEADTSHEEDSGGNTTHGDESNDTPHTTPEESTTTDGEDEDTDEQEENDDSSDDEDEDEDPFVDGLLGDE